MTTPHRKPVPAPADASPARAAPVTPWPWLLAQPLLDSQRLQWKVFLGGWQAIAAFHRDLWEQWAVRYCGGMPIDS